MSTETEKQLIKALGKLFYRIPLNEEESYIVTVLVVISLASSTISTAITLAVVALIGLL